MSTELDLTEANKIVDELIADLKNGPKEWYVWDGKLVRWHEWHNGMIDKFKKLYNVEYGISFD